jgi:hypothetical protein
METDPEDIAHNQNQKYSTFLEIFSKAFDNNLSTTRRCSSLQLQFIKCEV